MQLKLLNIEPSNDDEKPKKRGYNKKPKCLDDFSIKQIVGREADTSKLKPPYFPNETNAQKEPSPFRKRVDELFKRKP